MVREVKKGRNMWDKGMKIKKLSPQELSLNLRKAIGMRNFLAHQYDNIEDEIVFNAINSHFLKDVEKFLNLIEKEI